MSEQIKRAIEWLESENYYIGSRVGECIQTQVYGLSIQALKAELVRQENKALTEAEVRELVKNKEPVFYKPIDKVWEECDIESKWFIADECMLIAEWLQVGNFYKHKPKGEK